MCGTWQATEQMAVNHLGPLLVAAEESGDVAAWWFLRRGDSGRLRVLPADSCDATAVLGRLTSTLTERAAVRHVEGVIYESGSRRLRNTTNSSEPEQLPVRPAACTARIVCHGPDVPECRELLGDVEIHEPFGQDPRQDALCEPCPVRARCQCGPAVRAGRPADRGRGRRHRRGTRWSRGPQPCAGGCAGFAR
ncbi:hypothetical protein DXZ75_05685 [Streptomyces sp. AcE210]|nr:hypothetical protein DXZ75_05685 [Streptomyces sp. AcE210]